MSEKKKSKKDVRKPTYRIPAGSPWAKAWMIALAVGVLGSAAAFFGASSDPRRFAFSWLFAFMTVLAVALGSLFFILKQHLTGAGWSVTLRRTSEFLLSGLPVFALLFVPIGLNMDQLYPWTEFAHESAEHGDAHEAEGADERGDEHSFLMLGGSVAHGQEIPHSSELHPDQAAELAAAMHGEEGEGEHGAHDSPEHALHHDIVASKTAYLNPTGFWVRAGIYFLIWIGLTMLFVGTSIRQDKEKGLAGTKTMQRWAPLSTFAFGLTLTFAAFDWVMSMEPGWYSTIFGVQYFAVSAIIANAVIILITMGLRNAGHLGNAVHLEHYHDIGKLLFGFVVFWAYISFSQFMLIWYAGIPEEATYFHLRWWGGGGFRELSIALVLLHFAAPFFMLISRNTKRRLNILMFASVWLVVTHVLQMYWAVMPYAEQTGLVATSLRLHWMDLAALFGVGGIYMAVVFWQMTRHPLVPVGDPRLDRALHHEVV